MLKIIFLTLLLAIFGSCMHKPVKTDQNFAMVDQFQLPDTPAYRRAWELLTVINIGTKNCLKEYLAKNAIPSIHEALDFFQMVHRDTIRLSIEKVENTDDRTSAKLLLRSEITGLPMNFGLTVEKAAPNKITSFGLDFGDLDVPEGEKISIEHAQRELEVFFNKICQSDMFSGSVLLAKKIKSFFKLHAKRPTKTLWCPIVLIPSSILVP